MERKDVQQLRVLYSDSELPAQAGVWPSGSQCWQPSRVRWRLSVPSTHAAFLHFARNRWKSKSKSAISSVWDKTPWLSGAWTLLGDGQWCSNAFKSVHYLGVCVFYRHDLFNINFNMISLYLCILKKKKRLKLNLACIRVDINRVKRYLLLDCTVTFLKVEHLVNKYDRKNYVQSPRGWLPFGNNNSHYQLGCIHAGTVQTQTGFPQQTAPEPESRHVRHIHLPHPIHTLSFHTQVTCSQSVKASLSEPSSQLR